MLIALRRAVERRADEEEARRARMATQTKRKETKERGEAD
jgi:hypothetical protein